MSVCKEINIIKIFSSAFSDHKDGVVGIGDDCAVLPINNNSSMVVTTDTMTEDVHFIMSLISPEDLAYKALSSNISDVISMGALPTYAFLSITLTSKCDEQWIKRFSESLSSLAHTHGITLMGGDTTFSPHALTITITLTGNVDNKNIKLRSGAKPSDKIFCCSSLGASATGLELIQRGHATHPATNVHYRPHLFVDESQWLSRQKAVTDMMDISDGIAKDLTHILERSGVGAAIELSKIPIAESTIELCRTLSIDPLKQALEGGEEYSLLFTVDSAQSEFITEEYFRLFNHHIYEIGECNNNKNIITWLDGGKPSNKTFKGYDHFRNDR
ncbi:MAG: thiamine-phosphate kinase [Rikenellaceae bacterium]